jgi:PilZ domain
LKNDSTAAQPSGVAKTVEPAITETEDRRRNPRFDCDGVAEITLPHAGLRLVGRISDLSSAGCFVEAPSLNLERGTQVEIRFDANRLCFRVAGNIISLRPRVGVGIAFLHLTDRMLRQIGELIDELAHSE